MKDEMTEDVLVEETAPEVLEEDRVSEAIDGEPRERMMGAKAGRIAVLVARLLENYANPIQAGQAFGSDCGYQIFRHAPKLVRYPDVSFVRKGRLPDDEPPDENLKVVPDLVVEIVSPNDLAENVETRVTDFVRAGVPLIWVIYPSTRCVRVLKQGASSPILFETDELQGGDVLPGFSCRVSEVLTRK